MERVPQILENKIMSAGDAALLIKTGMRYGGRTLLSSAER